MVLLGGGKKEPLGICIEFAEECWKPDGTCSKSCDAEECLLLNSKVFSLNVYLWRQGLQMGREDGEEEERVHGEGGWRGIKLSSRTRDSVETPDCHCLQGALKQMFPIK